MKNNYITAIFIMINTLLSLIFQVLFSESPCNPHPLFNNLSNQSISGCEEKEFDKMKIEFTVKDGTWI